MTIERLHPLNFLLYKFTPAQTFNLLFADLQIHMYAFFPFLQIFTFSVKYSPFFGSYSSTVGLASCFQPDQAHYISAELICGLASLQEM